MIMERSSKFGIVLIGRNEGERLHRCVLSLPRDIPAVYVDSGSTDQSVEWTRNRGIEVVELDTEPGFTAARARNAGFQRLKALVPRLRYVQFVDGDCELATAWPLHALAFLEAHTDVCAVFGRRRERFPERSVYNQLCDIEWDVPFGEAKTFGGDVMVRADALEAMGGYRSELIAGEEPELCVRLRAKGWILCRIDSEMTLHDAAITRFSQWWRRHVRSGYAFAEGAFLHGESPERHFVPEARRSLIWGLMLPIVCSVASILAWPWGLAAWLIYPLQMLRLFFRESRPLRERATLAVFRVIMRFPEAQGWLKFQLLRLMGQKAEVIDYK
jgi:GT2 family glycosyltransferase